LKISVDSLEHPAWYWTKFSYAGRAVGQTEARAHEFSVAMGGQNQGDHGGIFCRPEWFGNKSADRSFLAKSQEIAGLVKRRKVRLAICAGL
jgi:hypothetical protein